MLGKSIYTLGPRDDADQHGRAAGKLLDVQLWQASFQITVKPEAPGKIHSAYRCRWQGLPMGPGLPALETEFHQARTAKDCQRHTGDCVRITRRSRIDLSPMPMSHRPVRTRQAMSPKRQRHFSSPRASRGIGLAIALRAGRDGANIAIAAKTRAAPSEASRHDPHSRRQRVEQAGGKAPRRWRSMFATRRRSGPVSPSTAGRIRRHRYRGQQCQRRSVTAGRQYRHAPLRSDE